ncbi:LysR family transcriptional regulator [Enterococcus pseudoavium]|uniref:LysR family transcriptional regulator n=1 Tax=Enterococcus pseudoavium TaxID=44007 RepID=A0ABU3FL27_9ENTE|nr:LysR family transcriptional regulator [Enterococcus pseudoavium]MDT2753585.1 LysR family transcriptional regulator [Enterococcus pseudoavium]MDT2771435.1 LysR family transcriptional regulator [Enterococcus pseudoavium]REC32456.1 LysR family transcriptional regulator [Enterococcus pseudoavium]
MIELLRTFIIVYETRNFSTAAKKMFKTQPTISIQIQKLESELGFKLFERKGKQLILPTKQAKFLYPKLVESLNSLSSLFAHAKNAKNFKIDCILACSNTTAVYLLPKIMSQLVTTFPLIAFEIKIMNSQEVIDAVEENKAQIGLIEKSIVSPLIQKEFVYKDELVLAGNIDSDFWILRENDSGMYFINETYLYSNHLAPQIVKANNSEVILSLLQNKLGKSIISKLALPESLDWQELDAEFRYRDLFIIQNIQSPNPETASVYEKIKLLLAELYDHDSD